MAETLGVTVTELLEGELVQGSEVTADAAENAAIRGIKAYLKSSQKKVRILWAGMAVLIVILASIGTLEYVRYSRRPIDFRNDRLNFGYVVYIDESKEKHEFKLDDPLGKELKGQILAYLKNEMVQGTEVPARPSGGRSEESPQVKLTGLISFYRDCYYDHRSEKYYKLNWMEDPYRKMTGLCEDLICDASYEYTGGIHFENQGCTLDINCALTEKPMELIIDYYRQIIDKPMLMYGKEASNRKQEIDRQHYTIPNQRPKDKHFEKI